jgi:hypothetical protein
VKDGADAPVVAEADLVQHQALAQIESVAQAPVAPTQTLAVDRDIPRPGAGCTGCFRNLASNGSCGTCAGGASGLSESLTTRRAKRSTIANH